MSVYDDEWDGYTYYVKDRKMNKKDNKFKMNKFYTASDKISNPIADNKNAWWTRSTLAEATKHAEELMIEHPDRDCVCIVKIVRIVRRKQMPLVFEDVR